MSIMSPAQALKEKLEQGAILAKKAATAGTDSASISESRTWISDLGGNVNPRLAGSPLGGN